MARPSTDDHYTSNRLFCDPHNGSRSPQFMKFKRDFKTGADAMFLNEDDWSIWQAGALTWIKVDKAKEG